MSATAARPRVLYVTPMFGYPPRGGPRLRTYTTLQALSRCADVFLRVTQEPDLLDEAKARQEITALCKDAAWPQPTKPPLLPERAVRRLWRTLGGRTRVVPPPSPGEVVDQLAEQAQQVRADVVWLGFGGISYHLLPLKQRTGLPLVLETESVWSRFILRELLVERDPMRRAAIEREGRKKEAEEQAGAALPDVTTAVSEVDADYFRRLAPQPERVMRLNNVVDVRAYAEERPGVPLAQPALCFPGTLSAGTANVDAVRWLVQEILPLVWDKRPDVHLYLVGRDPSPAVRACAGPHVHVVGGVTSVVPYLRAATAEVVPLRWESGTRFKILEAFACRAPVVSTAIGAEGLEVQDGRHLLLADTAAVLADAILRLIQDQGLRERLTDAAYDLVATEYDVSTAARQAAAILRRVGLATRDPVDTLEVQAP